MPSALLDGLRARLRLTPGAIAARIPVPPAAPDQVPLSVVCRPELWDDPTWRRAWRELGLQEDASRLHRKGFEWCQLVYGLRRLGVMDAGPVVVGVGTGHERTLYWLTRQARRVVATDLFRGEFTSSVAAEADPAFLTDPDRFAPFPYERRRLVGLPADGRALPFRSGSVDVVYSLSSIEHFGGHDAAALAMREMARVLRPGGIACVATELILEGGVHAEYFTEAELQEHVIGGHGLVLVEQADLTPPARAVIDDPVWLPHVDVTPHLVLAIGALRWTSVVLFFRKPSRRETWWWGGRATVERVGRRLRPRPREA